MAQITSTVRSLVAVGVAAAAIVALTTAPPAAASTAWSRGVTNICAHALLFEGSHEIGTRAGAVAVAQDIRASTERRLARIATLPVPQAQRTLTVRWLAVESRLRGGLCEQLPPHLRRHRCSQDARATATGSAASRQTSARPRSAPAGGSPTRGPAARA